MPTVHGHAFISYVREDSSKADELTALLRDAGIPVWRDTEDLWPGEDWRDRIREAITDGAFAFIPIFTTTSEAKGVSGQNDELYLAADEMRRRRPGASWIFPVRFDDCKVPRLRLGGGRTLDDIQRADFFGPNASRQADRLVEAVRRIIATTSQGESAPAVEVGVSPAYERQGTQLESELKSALRDSAGDMRLHDLVIPIANAVHDELADVDRYPVDGTATVLDIVGQVDRYWKDLDGLLEILVIAGPWSHDQHGRTWTEVVQRVARSGERLGGNTARLEVRWFPLLPMVYAAGIAGLYRSNYGFLRAVALEPHVRDRGTRVPLIARLHPWTPFSSFELPAQLIALEASGEIIDDEVVNAISSGSRGKRYTPVSDHLHDRLRQRFFPLFPDDDDYSAVFDRLEVLLALLIVDRQLQAVDANGGPTGPYIPPPPTGRFSWRDRHSEAPNRIEVLLREELRQEGQQWGPLTGGLFGGSPTRAEAAIAQFIPIADKARARW